MGRNDASNDSFSSRVVAAAASSISAVFQQVVNHDSDNNARDSSPYQNNHNGLHQNERNNSKTDNGFHEPAMDVDEEDDEETDINATIERSKRSISITGLLINLLFVISVCNVFILIVDDEDDNLAVQQNGSSSESKASNSAIYPLHRIRRATGLIFKRIALADFDSDSDTSNCDRELTNTMKSTEIKNEESEDESEKKPIEDDKESYSYLMRQKINELPLPFALKFYLNYHRNL